MGPESAVSTRSKGRTRNASNADCEAIWWHCEAGGCAMKTRTAHVSNFGKFMPVGLVIDWNGFAEHHDSPRYSKAAIELAERALAEWRKE